MEELIKNLVEGSQEGWNEFVTRFNRLIYKVFCSRSFGFSREEIEELFHDFMVSMLKDDYRKVRQFEGRNECSFPSYLKKIAINMAIDRRKTLMRKHMTSLQTTWDRAGTEDGRELIDTIDSGVQGPEDVLVNQEEAAQFLGALYRLAPSKLVVVLLIIYHDYDRVELGRLLQTTRQNIDVIFNRCKEQLKKLLKAGTNLEDESPSPVRWSKNILTMKDRLVLEDRDAVLSRCLKELSIADELLIGIIFLNSLSLEPSPERMALALNCKVETALDIVEKTLKKISLPVDATESS
jgi:RNA polymerase sigma factor (sigma-70 family)